MDYTNKNERRLPSLASLTNDLSLPPPIRAVPPGYKREQEIGYMNTESQIKQPPIGSFAISNDYYNNRSRMPSGSGMQVSSLEKNNWPYISPQQPGQQQPSEISAFGRIPNTTYVRKVYPVDRVYTSVSAEQRARWLNNETAKHQSQFSGSKMQSNIIPSSIYPQSTLQPHQQLSHVNTTDSTGFKALTVAAVTLSDSKNENVGYNADGGITNRDRNVQLKKFNNGTDIGSESRQISANSSIMSGNIQFQGPPKTSRFYRFFVPDSGKHQFVNKDAFSLMQGPNSSISAAQKSPLGAKNSNVTHHYNPYIYPQNRNRVNPPPDFLSRVRDSYAESSPTKADPIPILHPTEKQFADPIKYIESLHKLGEKYGAVKIVPPHSYNPKFAANLESLWFKTRRQLWNSPVNELDARFEFHMHVLDAQEKGKFSFNKLPCIDKRSVDLWRLHKSVQLRGGFQKCCGEKMWAQMGRELGFYGKITSSLSSSIKSAYIRYILPLELENIRKRSLKNKHYISEKQHRKRNGKVYLPRITGSAYAFRRSRNQLICSGFNPYFDQGTTQKKGITINDSKTLPCYDFYEWHHCKEVNDTSPYQTRVSSLYNIRQCNDKSKVLKRMTLDNMCFEEGDPRSEDPHVLENAFWEYMNDPESVLETESACRISTTIHDSGFDSSPNKETAKYFLSPWNFHNLPVCKNSILQYLNTGEYSVLSPSMTFDMFYSVHSWTAEDHWLYNIDYEHMGDKRICYFIPLKHREKYETLLERLINEKEEEDADLSNCYSTFKEMVNNEDVYSTTVENRVLTDAMASRSHAKDTRFERFVKHEKSKRVNQDIFISPQYLKQHGIEVYGCIQEPGEFIVKFPGAFGSSISFGSCVSENVNFATPSWLALSELSLKWLQKQQLTPAFSNFELLLNISRKCKDLSVLRELQPTLENKINVELKQREATRTYCMGKLKESTDISSAWKNEFHITDADLLDCRPTFILLIDRVRQSSKFTMSLEYFLNHFDVNNDFRDFDAIMMLYFTDEELNKIKNDLQYHLMTCEAWIKKYENSILEYDLPQMDLAKLLVVEGERILENKSVTELDFIVQKTRNCLANLKKQISLTETWSFAAKKLLHKKNSNIWVSISEIKGLMMKISDLVLITPEIEEFKDLAKAVSNLNRDIQTRICDADEHNSPVSKLKELYNKGQQLKIKFGLLDVLSDVVKRRLWTDKVLSVEQGKLLYSYDDLLEEGRHIGKREDGAILEKLQNLNETSKELEKEAQTLKEMSYTQVSGDELEHLSKRLNKIWIDVSIRSDIEALVKEYENSGSYLKSLVTTFKEIQDKKVSNTEMVVSLKDISTNISKASIFIELQCLVKQVREKIVMPLECFYERMKEAFVEFPKDEMTLEHSLERMVLHDKRIFGEKMDSHNYCVCRSSKEDDAMIECEACQEWYHFKCLGLDSDNISSEDLNKMGFFCPICDFDDKLTTTKQQNEIRNKRPRMEALENLFSWIKQNITVRSKVVSLIVELYEDGAKFRSDFQETLIKYNSEGNISETDQDKVLFVLRILEASSINFTKDREELRGRLRALYDK